MKVKHLYRIMQQILGLQQAIVGEKSEQKCAECGAKASKDALYCSICGSKLPSVSTRARLDAMVKTKVDAEVEKRFSTDALLVREISDKIEATFWIRMRWSIGILAIVGAIVGFMGYSKWTDLTQMITTAGQPALETARQAKLQVDKAQREINNVLVSIRATEKDAQEAQTNLSKRIKAISNTIQAASDDANQKLAVVTTQVQGVINQTQTANVVTAFPLLGKAGVLELGDRPWIPNKKPGEKWVRIFIEPSLYSQFKPEHVKKLSEALSQAGFVIVTGYIGRTPPDTYDYVSLSDQSRNEVLFAHPQSLEIARQAQAIASKIFKFSSDVVKPAFPDAKDRNAEFVYENEPIDAEIFLRSDDLP